MDDPTTTSSKSDVPRWQTEVEEILERSDRDSTSYEKARAAAIATRYKAPDRAKAASEKASSRFGDGLWLLFALGVGIAAWLAGLHWPLAGRVLALASLLLFAGFVVRAVMRSRSSSETPKTWRGREMDEGDAPKSIWPSRNRDNSDDDPPLVGSGR